MNSRRFMSCPQSGDDTLPYRGRKYGVVHHGRFWPLRSEMGHKPNSLQNGPMSAFASCGHSGPLALIRYVP
jgi:hypothetical protein